MCSKAAIIFWSCFLVFFFTLTEELAIRWQPPEVLQSSEYKVFNEKTEVWSFAVLIYELITNGEIPYKC